MRDRRICREGDPEWTSGVPVRHETIPVVHDGRVIAVIERSTNLSAARTPSRMDIAYLRAADDLAQMVAAGMFPSTGEEPALVRSPRVGDGLLRLSKSGKVTYASPNALSAYRRLGLTADLVGAELGPLTAKLCTTSAPRDDSLMLTASGRARMETELEGNGSVVQLRTIPLVVDGDQSGRAGPGPRRHRAAPPGARAHHEGRHDPGNPPSGQEQPADRGRAAAAAGAQAIGTGGARRAGGSRPQGRLHRHRPRNALACAGRGRGLRRHSAPGRDDGGGGVRAGDAGHPRAVREVRQAARVAGHPAGPGADRIAAERAAARPDPADRVAGPSQ